MNDMQVFCNSRENFDIYYSIGKDKNGIDYLYLDTLIIVGVKNRYKGEGTKELNNIINIAKKNSCRYIELSADLRQKQAKGFSLIEWYKKFGFETLSINKGYTALMRKEIKYGT